MRKFSVILTVFAVLAVAGAAMSFTSTRAYQYGIDDREVTMAVVSGDASITAGQWLTLAYADTQSLDTAAVVKAAQGENVVPIFGVADQSGVGGSYIRVITRGVAEAYVTGTDSGNAVITNGRILASSKVTGVAGAAASYMTTLPSSTTTADTYHISMGADTAAATKICGFALETVATTDTGAYKYSVYVMGR